MECAQGPETIQLIDKTEICFSTKHVNQASTAKITEPSDVTTDNTVHGQYKKTRDNTAHRLDRNLLFY